MKSLPMRATFVYFIFYLDNHNFPIYFIRERGRDGRCDYIGGGKP